MSHRAPYSSVRALIVVGLLALCVASSVGCTLRDPARATGVTHTPSEGYGPRYAHEPIYDLYAAPYRTSTDR